MAIKVIIQDVPGMARKDLYILETDVNGRATSVFEPVTFVRKAIKRDSSEINAPTLSFDYYDGGDLLDALKLALIGENKSVNEGELSAVKEHLSDMKVIAFNKLGIKEDK